MSRQIQPIEQRSSTDLGFGGVVLFCPFFSFLRYSRISLRHGCEAWGSLHKERTDRATQLLTELSMQTADAGPGPKNSELCLHSKSQKQRHSQMALNPSPLRVVWGVSIDVPLMYHSRKQRTAGQSGRKDVGICPTTYVST